MRKLIDDTLKVNGKYSQKRIMIFCSFNAAFMYAIMPLMSTTFEVKEFVFLGFLSFGGFTIFRNQKVNENTKQEIVE